MTYTMPPAGCQTQLKVCYMIQIKYLNLTILRTVKIFPVKKIIILVT
jgi:hypothetical protein